MKEDLFKRGWQLARALEREEPLIAELKAYIDHVTLGNPELPINVVAESLASLSEPREQATPFSPRLAWWYRAYAREQRAQDQRDYERAERAAQERRAGLWREKEPMPPWEWRRERREQSAAKRLRKPASNAEA